jgi:uncharacterized protein YecT (DUF1311 family)
MKTLKIVLSAALSLCVLQYAYADDKGLTKQYAACMDKTEGSNGAMGDCIEHETKRQDARLNKNYRELAASLPANRKKQLQVAQRAWIQYRDANCAFYLDPDGGTQAFIDAGDCTLSQTVVRATELEKFKQ